MDTLVVEKNKAVVTVILPNKAKLKGEVFLASFSDSHYGHQKVSDILEDDKTFVPISIEEEKRVEFLNKDQIVIVEGECATPEDEEKLSMGLYQVQGVRITFANEDTISGDMISEVPQERSRLSDCLNLENMFITMVKDGRYFYLNKSMITRVEGISNDGS